MSQQHIDRGKRTIREVSQGTNLSIATIARYTSRTRAEWLAEKAAEREDLRVYHDDEGHSWAETGRHFGIDPSTARKRAFRARKERAAEERERQKLIEDARLLKLF